MDLPVQQFRTKAEQTFLDIFEGAEKALPGADNKWASGLRTDAIAAYARLGLPHRRIEAWKYSDLRARLTDAAAPVRATGAPVSEAALGKALGTAIAALPAYRLVIVDGELRADLSDFAGLKKAGVELHSLGESLEKPPAWLKKVLGQVNAQENAVVALNTALVTNGAVLRVPEGVTLDKPVHVIDLTGSGEPVASFTRNVLVAEEGASIALLESYAGLGGRGLQRNAATEVLVGNKAAVEHYKFQLDDSEAIHLTTWLVRVGADARYDAFQFSLGAGFARNQIYVRFAGEGSALDISGAVLMRDRQHCDTTLVVEHNVPHCTSRELLKAVLDEEARGIFQGKIIVAPGAQKTDGKQMAGALLLSEKAEFDSKPELEIFADDVVCGHGSTSGQIDEDLLFYLEARGIPESAARALLIQAFVGEALEKVKNEGLRDAFAAASAGWLGVAID
jgi:FeS assembly protein SufD